MSDRIDAFFRLLDHPRFWRGVFLLVLLALGYILLSKPDIIGAVIAHGDGRQNFMLMAWSAACAFVGYLVADVSCTREFKHVRETMARDRQAIAAGNDHIDLLERKLSAMRSAMAEAFFAMSEGNREEARAILDKLDKVELEAEATFKPRSARHK